MEANKKKIGIIVGSSFGAVVLAIGVVALPSILSKDDSSASPTLENTNQMEEVVVDDGSYVRDELFENGSSEDEGTFYPSLGVEATYSEDGTPKVVKPWYSLSEDNDSGKSSSLTKQVSAKAKGAYTDIISKINQDHKVKSASMNSVADPATWTTPVPNEPNNNTGNESYEDSYQSQFEGLKEFTETLQVENEDLKSKVSSLTTGLDEAKQFEDMYLNLLNSQQAPQQTNPNEPVQNNGNNNTVTNPVNNPNTSVTNPTTGTGNVANTPPVQSDPNVDSSGNIYVTKFDEVKNITTDPVVVGTATQFKHLDSLKESYYVLTTKTNAITSHFSDLLAKYTNQLVVSNLDYKKIDGYQNLYLVTPTYLVTQQQVLAIQNEAKLFNERLKSLDEEDYLIQLADYIASKAYYGTNDAGIYSPYNIFIGKPAVCQAYTAYAKIFLDARGIQSSIAVGSANGVAHTWNVVTMDNVDYHYDFTWYDTTEKQTRYLMATTRQISTDHQITQIIKAVY